MTDLPHDRDVPWSNALLIAGCAAVFFLQQLRPATLGQWQLSVDELAIRRFVSYSFVHLNWPHMVFNIVALALVGGGVNRRLGHFGYLAFYFGGAVVAGVGFLLAGGEAVAGASGAVSAVMAAYLVLLTRRPCCLGPFRFAGVYIVLGYALYNILMPLAVSSTADRVAYPAHLAGLAYGLFVSIGLLTAGLIPRTPTDLFSLVGRP